MHHRQRRQLHLLFCYYILVGAYEVKRSIMADAFQHNPDTLSRQFWSRSPRCPTASACRPSVRTRSFVGDHTTSNRSRRMALHAKKESQKPTTTSESNSVTEAEEEDEVQSEQQNQDNGSFGTYSARFLEDNGIDITTDDKGRVTTQKRPILKNTTEKMPASSSSPSSSQHPSDTKKGQNVQSSTSVNSDSKADKNVQTSSATISEAVTEAPAKPKTGPEQDADEPKLNPIFKRSKLAIKEQPAKVVPQSGFNVVLTHCTADFDSLASAVGLAKLWASDETAIPASNSEPTKNFDSASHVPTFVVLPRGAHPGVQRFLALHKHLFPIRSLKSLPSDLTGLNRLGLVDAQRRDRIGPAENLLQYAQRITVVDHHIDNDSDLGATDYVVDKVGSVSTLMVERIQQAELDLTEAEATLLALGIHADTGSLCFDSTTPRDCMALAWVMSQGASQAAIAEHAQSSLSPEQQGVLTQALINSNSTVVHGVTVSTVLLSADGFINGLAAVTHDALELSSSDVFLLAVVYEAQSGGKRRSKGSKNRQGERLTSRLLHHLQEHDHHHQQSSNHSASSISESTDATTMFTQAWRGGEEAMRRRRLRAAFDRIDLDVTGYLDQSEIAATLAATGIIASDEAIQDLMDAIDLDGDGRVDFEEFVDFAISAERHRQEEERDGGKKAMTMIIIGRAKAGVNLKSVKLNKLLEQYGGGGHAKAASATVRLRDEMEAEGVLQGLVDELIHTSLQEQSTVGDFMMAPVLSVKPHMTEKQVEDLFTRYDVRALPVVDDENEVIGLVTYKEVAAAKQRLWNKEQKRLRREKELAEKGQKLEVDENVQKQRSAGSTVKAWMKQHVQLVEASTTMAELEAILLEVDVGCLPVVADGTKQLIGMVSRTDLLRQHRYYPSLHYHNKGFADSIASRKPIIELRKRLKKFDDLDQ